VRREFILKTSQKRLHITEIEVHLTRQKPKAILWGFFVRGINADQQFIGPKFSTAFTILRETPFLSSSCNDSVVALSWGAVIRKNSKLRERGSSC
jgi:hypothetical protein